MIYSLFDVHYAIFVSFYFESCKESIVSAAAASKMNYFDVIYTILILFFQNPTYFYFENIAQNACFILISLVQFSIHFVAFLLITNTHTHARTHIRFL